MKSVFFTFLYIYLSSISIAFFISLISFRYSYPKHMKLFSILLGITFLVELMANFGFKMLHLKGYRSALYTGFSLFEFISYAYFFFLITDIKWVRKAHIIFMCFFPFIWAGTIFFGFGFKNWNSPEIAIGGFFTVCFSLLYIYYLSLSDDFIELSRNSEFWIAIGLIVFYSCEIPYLGVLHFLNDHYLVLSKKILLLSMLIDSTMYCFFTYAILCRKRKYS